MKLRCAALVAAGAYGAQYVGPGQPIQKGKVAS